MKINGIKNLVLRAFSAFSVLFITPNSFAMIINVQNTFTIPFAENGSEVAWDGSGFWVLDGQTNTVYKYDLTGSIIDSFTSPVAPDYQSLAFDGNNLWFTAAHRNNVNLYKVDTDGNLLFSVNTGLSGLGGLTWDGANLRATQGSNSLITLDSNGQVINNLIYSQAGGAGYGLSFDGTGFITDHFSIDTLYRISPNGSVLDTVYIGVGPPQYVDTDYIGNGQYLLHRNVAGGGTIDVASIDWPGNGYQCTRGDGSGFCIENDPRFVPEPSTLLLLSSGLVGAFLRRRKV